MSVMSLFMSINFFFACPVPPKRYWSTAKEVFEYLFGGTGEVDGMLKKGEFRLSMVCVVDVFMC